MKFFLDLNSSMDEEFFTKLVNFYNQECDETDIFLIYLCSDGGYSHVANAAIDLINSNMERTVLIAYGRIFSAAFSLFTFVKCEKRIVKGTRGMTHQSTVETNINESGKVLDRNILKHMVENQKTETEELLKTLNLTKKEITTLKKGDDLFFTYNRLIDVWK